VPILISPNKTISHSAIEGVTFDCQQRVVGTLVLDDYEKVVQYPSEWLTNRVASQGISYATAQTYARNITYFLDYLKRRPDSEGLTHDEMLLRVRLSALESWFIEQSNEGMDRSTNRNREACLRSFYDYLSDGKFRDPVLERSPFSTKYVTPKPHKKQVVRADLNDLVALMNQSKYERDRVLLQFMYDSGVRISEVERITYNDIRDAINFTNSGFVCSRHNLPVHPDYAPLLIRGSKGRGNSIKERYTLVSTPTLKRIATYHSSPLYKRHQMKYGDRGLCPAFLNTEGGAYNKASLAKLFERLSKKAKTKGLVTKSIHAHLLRHGSAYLILQDPNLGSDYLERLVNVKKTLGHTFISTTEVYTSIPFDIYDSIVDEKGVMKSKTDLMEEVVEQTKLRIRIGDKK
jgi:site-specific recombinase XerD